MKVQYFEREEAVKSTETLLQLLEMLIKSHPLIPE